MATLGASDLKNLMIPTGVDGGELMRWKLADGTTYDVVVSEIARLLVVANSDMFADPIYGSMIYITSELFEKYTSGTGIEAVDRSEYATSDPQRGDSVGHMLPMKGVDVHLAWTQDYLKKANMSDI